MPPRPPAPPARRPPADFGWLLACVGGFLGLCWSLRSFITDDAWISVRYAENLAAGHGFVWNPGGEPTEGFSNPLLVAVEAAVHLAGGSAVGAARVLGVASAVLLLVAVHRMAPAAVGRAAALTALPLIALYPPVALWAVGGLETMPVTLAITVAALLLARPDPTRRDAVLAGAVLAVLPWLRPEGLVVALALIGAAEGVSLLRPRTRRAALGRVALAAGIPVAAQIVLEVLRQVIYGHWLPNSVIYKVGGSDEPLIVLAKFVGEALPVALLGVAGLLVLRGRARVLLVPAAVYAVGSIGTLDSVNAFSRFLLPVFPVLAIAAAATLVALAHRLTPARATAVAVLAATGLAGYFVAFAPARQNVAWGFAHAYDVCRTTARADAAAWLQANTPPSAVVSTGDAGLVPARAGDRFFVDGFMLNERFIQSTGPLSPSARANFVFSHHPDVVVLASRRADRLVPHYAVDRRLAGDPAIRSFELAHVARGARPWCGYHLFLYRR